MAESGAAAEEDGRLLKQQEASSTRPAEPSKDPVKFESLASLVLPLFFPAVVMHMTRAMVITVLPLHVLSLGMSYDDVGLLTTIGGVGMMFSNIPIGALITARGPRAALLLSCGLYVAEAVLACLAKPGSAFAPLAAAFLLLGVAENTSILARQTFMGATVPRNMRGRAGSTLGGTQRFGYSVGPCVGGLVAGTAGHRAAYALQAAIALVGAVAMLCLMPPISATQDISPKAPDAQAQAREVRPPSMSSVARRHWRCLLLISVFSACLTCVRKTRELLFSLEGHAQQWSQAEVGSLAAASYSVDAMLFPIAGILLDSKGRTWTGAASLCGSAAALLLLLGRSMPAMVAFSLVSGAANGLSAGVILSMGADMAPPDSRGHFLALFRTLSRSADVIAPALMGWLARSASLPAAEVCAAAVGVAGAVWVRCLVPETLHSEPTEAAAADCKPAVLVEALNTQELRSVEDVVADLESAPLKVESKPSDAFSN